MTLHYGFLALGIFLFVVLPIIGFWALRRDALQRKARCDERWEIHMSKAKFMFFYPACFIIALIVVLGGGQ